MKKKSFKVSLVFPFLIYTFGLLSTFPSLCPILGLLLRFLLPIEDMTWHFTRSYWPPRITGIRSHHRQSPLSIWRCTSFFHFLLWLHLPLPLPFLAFSCPFLSHSPLHSLWRMWPPTFGFSFTYAFFLCFSSWVCLLVHFTAIEPLNEVISPFLA